MEEDKGKCMVKEDKGKCMVKEEKGKVKFRGHSASDG